MSILEKYSAALKNKDETNKVNIHWKYSNDDKESVLKFFLYLDKMFKENDDEPFSGLVFDIDKTTANKILECIFFI